MGRVIVDVALTNFTDKALAKVGALPADQVRHLTVSGVVDSGASYLVLPESVTTALGLSVTSKANVQYADGCKTVRPVVGEVNLELKGREGIFKAIVEPDRQTALIGAIVLEDLDLLVDCRRQTLIPRDPDAIVAEIE
jgi:predicted aspartyl protease